MWMEHGPYRVSNSHGGIELNPYSWNRLGNVLYLEHPVGVGFSYAENTEDYNKLGDDLEAEELYAGLIAFAKRYPQFAPSPSTGLFLTGESYAGEYIPHLAHKILTGGQSELLRSSLRGFAVGNPIFYCAASQNGKELSLRYAMFFHHGLMSHEQYAKWAAAGCDNSASFPADRCSALFDQAEAAVGTVNQQLLNRSRKLLGVTSRRHPLRHRGSGRALRRSVAAKRESAGGDGGDTSVGGGFDAAADPVEAEFDPDHKYQSFCRANATLEFAVMGNADKDPACHPLGYRPPHSRCDQRADGTAADRLPCVDCSDPGRMAVYLNRPDVHRALHIDASKMRSPVWTDCADDAINYTTTEKNIISSYYEPIFDLTGPSFKVLVYSGDEDIATVPTPVTQQCLSELQPMTRVSNWSAWSHNGITGGYHESFERYSFATIKGAGHTAPQYQPVLTFELIQRWLAGKV